MKKSLLVIVVLLVILFSGIWLFNHVNGWLGIGVIIIGLYAGIKFIVSFIKNYKKDEEN